MLVTIHKTSRFAGNLARRLASAAGVLAAVAALASPAAAQTTNAFFISLGGTGSAGYQDGPQGVSAFNTPSAVATLTDGYVYVADFGNNRVRKVAVQDEHQASTFVSTNVNRPVGLAFDSGANLFVANQGAGGLNSGTITKYDPQGNYIATFRSAPTGGSITALAIDEIDYIYVAHANGIITRIAPSGFVADTYQGSAGSDFRGVAVHTDGSVFASDANRHVIWRFFAPGQPPEVYAGLLNSAGKGLGSAAFGQFNRPHHIAFAPNGTLVVADRGNHQLRAVSCEGGNVSILVGIDPSLWFDFDSPEVFPGWWDSSPQFAELRDPVGVTVDSLGQVFDTEVYYHLVRGGRSVAYPPCGDETGGPGSIIISPNTGIFTNQMLTVTPASGGTFPEGTRLYYTRDGTDPTTSSSQVPIVNGIGQIILSGDFGNLRVRSYLNGVLGPIVAGLPTDFAPVAVQISPNQGFYPNGVEVQVTSAAAGGFGPLVQIYYTLDGTDPTTSSTPAAIQNGVATINLAGPVDLSTLRVRAFNNGVPGPVTQGGVTPIPLPGLNPPSGYFLTNVVVTVTNANSSSGLFPNGTRIFYSIDGSTPTQSSPEATVNGGIAQIILTGPFNLENLRVRAYLGNTGSAVVSGQPTSDIPNRISFGFEPPQEVSSDFVASAGQRFIAPVTLTIRPGQTMYGLQFSLLVTNLTGPASANYGQGFESMLMKPDPENPAVFLHIPPASYISKTITIEPFITPTNVIWVTNVTLNFTNLLVTNSNNNLLAVGWLERRQATNLYDTTKQDLITYSLPHDNMYYSSGGKVVPGAYSFVVPPTAQIGQTYEIEIIRPSANADGISQDVFIETPNDPSIPIRAVQTVTVGERRYIVGDLAPFRWFNAGDFGDGNVLNNDMEQIHQTVIYGVNAPPRGSDFEGAIDSCCVDTNGVDRAAGFQPWEGNDTVINQIGFGDGELNVADLFVSFRRALDPTLVWYERYWSNGVLRANVIPNTFRGQISGFSETSFKNTSTKPVGQLSAASTESSSVEFIVSPVIGSPGETVEVPIYAKVKGPNPIRTLMLSLKVSTVDGRAVITEPVSFWAHPLLGGPTFGGSGTASGYAAAWLDPNHPGLSGDALIGTLSVKIPANATASSAFLVHIDKVSASPNGIGLLPSTTQSGAIIMANRPNVGWNDGIPDAWRIQYFGTLATLKAAVTFDADGDGVNNGTEFQLGSNPTNPGDHLKVAGSILPDQTMRFRFPTAAGFKYQLLVSTNLSDWSVVQENILGTGSEIELTSISEAPLGYYRIQVQQD